MSGFSAALTAGKISEHSGKRMAYIRKKWEVFCWSVTGLIFTGFHKRKMLPLPNKEFQTGNNNLNSALSRAMIMKRQALTYKTLIRPVLWDFAIRFPLCSDIFPAVKAAEKPDIFAAGKPFLYLLRCRNASFFAEYLFDQSFRLTVPEITSL